jgi:hypothetical protein
MNLTTIGNIPSSNWKRVATHSVSAVAGVALAISAVVAFGWSTSGPTSVVPSRGASVLAVIHEATYETIQDYAAREQALLATYSMPSQAILIPAADAAEEAARSLIPDAQLVRP